eukprot:scaffold29456_cov84-Isochrysis_galbana.AAC.1
MEFIDGFNIKELRGKGSSASAETVRAVVTKLVEAFSLTMHGEIFNCDPHPGNLLVERVTGRLVILDWGQARQPRQHGPQPHTAGLGGFYARACARGERTRTPSSAPSGEARRL